MTALMAVVALVFGAMTLAGPALAKDDNPNKPDDPGNSANAPGQTNTPPGQNPGDTPGASHDKITICHFVEGKGETKDGYNIITMSEQAWAAHLAHHPGTLDVVYNGVSCPTVVQTYGSSASICLSTWPTAKKVEVSGQATQSAADEALLAMLANDYPGSWAAQEGTACTTPQLFGASTSICLSTLATAKKVEVSGQATQSAADEALQAMLAKDFPGSWAAAEGTACTTPPAETVPEVVAVAPVEAATVTAEPEAVAAPQPAKVKAPKPATIPVAVPAGDGSSVPQTPAWVLALLALGTLGLLASGTRLVTARSR